MQMPPWVRKLHRNERSNCVQKTGKVEDYNEFETLKLNFKDFVSTSIDICQCLNVAV